MEFRLLGPLEVEADAGPLPLGGPKQRVALALLLLRPNRPVPAERLIDEIWWDEPPTSARNVLQTYLSRLRVVLGRARLEHRPGGYVLHADPSEIDLHHFQALVQQARTHALSDPAAAVDLYRTADGLWRGPALDDLSDQPSLRGDIAHLEELRAAATQDRIVLEFALGHHCEIVADLETLAARDPLREGLWRHLITALYRSGRQADALAAYRRARATLAELGLEPSLELKRLQRQVLQQDPALDVVGVPLRGFRVLERVGEGSFGVVHRALQPLVDREVAIKVVRPRLADDPDFIRRFEMEAQLVARLEHPHIVPLYDYWREPGGAYLVMRLLRGGSLRDALAHGPLDLARTVAVVEHVGAALASAHRRGVVHRDVKPENILFDEERNAYLSDFGIARDVTAVRAPQQPDSPGTWHYLSPEERRGEATSCRSDVYSLGVVLFEMLAGRHPFTDAPLNGAVPSLQSLRADVPRGLDDVVRRAMLEASEDRFPDAGGFASAVSAALDSASRAQAVRGPLRNPYKGLRPFLEPDSPDFAGREALIERLVARLAGDGPGSRLIALVGPSGCGKSSVVRAGLIPALRRGAVAASEGWFVAEMSPGARPFEELMGALLRLASAAPPPGLAERLERDDGGLAETVSWALPDDGSELLLVIDQFEELFTLVEDESQQALFLAALRSAATSPRGRVRVVLTLRADFFDRPLAHRGFAELLRAGTELVVPLDAEELERAITAPSTGVGATVDAGLVAQLVSDVLGRSSALPLLQFTLAELFDRGRDGTLGVASYRRLGGLAGAVARGAEEIYGDLSSDGKAAARQLFLRLVEPRDGAESTRRRVRRGELLSLTEDASQMEAVIDAYAGRRLLSFDCDATSREPTVELAHEAVITAWGRLQQWIEESRDDLLMQRHIAAAAHDWDEAGREPSFFVGGSRLEQLDSWRRRSDLALTPVERQFLDGSLDQRERLRGEDVARRARERQLEHRSLRRLRSLVGVLAAAALVAGGLTVFAFGQRTEADQERQVAVVRELAAAANSNLEIDAERSVLLALEAVELARSAADPVVLEAEESLHRAVVASRIELRVPGLGGALDWSPTGAVFVTEGPEESGLIDIRDASTGESVRSFRGHEADVNMVAFSHDGSMLATSGDDGAVNVWDPSTGERLRHFPGRGEVWGVSFSPDGSQLAAAWWADRAVRVWDIGTGRGVSEIAPLSASFATSFSPDGRRLGIATFDSGAVVADAQSGESLLTLEGQEFGVSDVDWSPDGRWIATSSRDSTVRLWDAGTGQSRFTLFGHKGEVVAADWSSDSARLVTGSNDGTAKVWQIGVDSTRELISISAQERGGGLWVAFSPDGDRIMTGDQEVTAVKIWDVGLPGDAEWANVPADSRGLGGVAFTPDGTGVVASGGDGTLSVSNAETGTRVRTLGPVRGSRADAVLAIDVSSGGLVAGTVGDSAQVWDLSTGAQLFSVDAGGTAEDVAWSADGSLLATASGGGLVEIVDRSGMEMTSLPDPGFRISAVRFSPDGLLLATARVSLGRPDPADWGVAVWDWEQRRIVLTIPGYAEAVAFSPDGASLATAPAFGPVRIWDVETGAERARLVGHTGAVNDVAFSADGSLVASGSTDGTVRLWDARTGVQRNDLRGHDGVVWDIAFSPDGTKLASASPTGVVRVWALDTDDLVGIARRSVTRELTDEECRQYLHVSTCHTK